MSHVFLSYFVKFHDYCGFLRIITYCYYRGLREQAAQKDAKMLCLDLLRGTHGLRLVPPPELCYPIRVLMPCFLYLYQWRKINLIDD